MGKTWEVRCNGQARSLLEAVSHKADTSVQLSVILYWHFHLPSEADASYVANISRAY